MNPDEEFICRFWIAYWQAKLLLLQGFPGGGSDDHS